MAHQQHRLAVRCAVAYKGRGSTSRNQKAQSDAASTSSAPDSAELLDRGKAIELVAAAVEAAIKGYGGSVQVDLKSPQV